MLPILLRLHFPDFSEPTLPNYIVVDERVLRYFGMVSFVPHHVVQIVISQRAL